jgi:hypothetical protein
MSYKCSKFPCCLNTKKIISREVSSVHTSCSLAYVPNVLAKISTMWLTSTATLLATTHSKSATKFNSCPTTTCNCRSQRLCILRCGSVVAHLLGLQIWILPRAWMAVPPVVCCQVEDSGMGWLLIQRSLIECGVSACYLRTLKMMGLTGAVEPFERKQHTYQPPTWKIPELDNGML